MPRGDRHARARSAMLKRLSAEPDVEDRPPQGKHCWVVDYPGHPGAWPGLLAGWKRAADGEWRGHVAVVGQSAEGLRLASLWIEARYLRPCEDSSAPGSSSREKSTR
jgi:hypothetical protein